MRLAAEELRAHGHLEAARAALESSIAWYASRPSTEPQSQGIRSGHARALYLLGRMDEANGLYEALRKEFPESVEYQGAVGTIAARLGRREDARRVAQELRDLDRPYLRGIHTLWRARIASLLGERETPLNLLREAFAQGQPFGLALHTDDSFESLRSDPGFRELLEPKG